MITGIGKDSEIIENSGGGRQSRLDYRFDLVDPHTMFILAEILYNGAKSHGEWNWRKLTIDENLNHALMHIYAYLAGDKQDDHLGHAFCRLMMAKSKELSANILTENDKQIK